MVDMAQRTKKAPGDVKTKTKKTSRTANSCDTGVIRRHNKKKDSESKRDVVKASVNVCMHIYIYIVFAEVLVSVHLSMLMFTVAGVCSAVHMHSCV